MTHSSSLCAVWWRCLSVADPAVPYTLGTGTADRGNAAAALGANTAPSSGSGEYVYPTSSEDNDSTTDDSDEEDDADTISTARGHD